jgi:hypothetical protein
VADENRWTAERVKQAINDHYTPADDDGIYQCNLCGMTIYAAYKVDEVPPPATVENVVHHEETQCPRRDETRES